MCFLHTPLICTCELQVFLLLRLSLQIYAMFDNACPGGYVFFFMSINFLEISHLISQFSSALTALFQEGWSHAMWRLVPLNTTQDRLHGWHTSMSKAVRLPGKFHHQIVPITTVLLEKPKRQHWDTLVLGFVIKVCYTVFSKILGRAEEKETSVWEEEIVCGRREQTCDPTLEKLYYCDDKTRQEMMPLM